MLPDLLQIYKLVLQLGRDRRHPTKRRPLQLLALIQALSILQQTHMISGNRLNQCLGACKLAECDAEVVGVVERVHQIAVERVDVRQLGEVGERCFQFLNELLSCEFDFTRVEVSDTADLEARTTVECLVSMRLRIAKAKNATYICVGRRR